jgi:hypothetical protein
MLELATGGGRDAASVDQAARRILSQPQFRQPPESIEARVRHWIGSRFTRLLNDAVSGHLGVIGGIALLVIAALVIWAIVSASRRIALDTPVRGIQLGGPRRPPADWLREAASCEASGDWRNALLARYRALVAELDRRGVVDEIAGRTTGEYRREVARALPVAGDDFAGVTDLFEQSRYGDRDVGPDDAASARLLSERVLAGTR